MDAVKQPKYTYSAAHQRYYEVHKDEIRERRKDYCKAYSKTYYEAHKEEINARRKQKREQEKQARQETPAV